MAKFKSVQVRKSPVRSNPSFLGEIITRLSYGDRVEVTLEQDDWIQVVVPDISPSQGWMHASALNDKKIILDAGAEDVEKAAGSDELALAGKGFNEQVESEFRKNNPDLDFTWVDNMEAIIISQNEIQQFLEKGQLQPKGGTA